MKEGGFLLLSGKEATYIETIETVAFLPDGIMKNMKKVNGKIIRVILYASTAGALSLALSAAAHAETFVNNNTSSVTNSISVSAHSGGNNAHGGENGEEGVVVEGSESAHVLVKTVINGETIEDFEKEYAKTETDADIRAEEHFIYESKDGSAVSETSVSVRLDGAETKDEEEETEDIHEEKFSSESNQFKNSASAGDSANRDKQTFISLVLDFFKHVFSFFRV